MQNSLWRLTGLIVLSAALLLTACSKDSDKPAKKKKPVHLVETASVKLESVGLTQIRTGSLTSPREVKTVSYTHLRAHETRYVIA